MKRLVLLLVTSLAAPWSAIGAEAPAPHRWIDPALVREADRFPGRQLTVILGFEQVPNLEPLRRDGFTVMGYEHLPVAVAFVPGHDVDRLLARSEIVSATLDAQLESYALPSAQPGNFGGTGDELSRSDRARALGVDGSGIGVAVIDLGTSSVHPGLRPRLLGGPTVQNVKVLVSPGRFSGAQPAESPVTLFLENDWNSDLTDGHGTHTAAIAAGTWTADGSIGGRAPGADLVAIGVGDALTLPWVLGGMEYVLANQERYDIRVVNNSWGVTGPYNALNPVNIATRALADAGILVVFAAGNSGPEPRTLNAYAQAPHVLAVGATTLSGAIANFSSRGSPTGGKPGPDLVAPGADIIGGRNQWLSANEQTYRTPWMDAAFVPAEHLNWYRALSGTSMAAPQVAGIAALIWEANPALTREDVTRILLETARPIVGYEVADQGAGLVDAEAAVRVARGEQVAAPDIVQPTVVVDDGDNLRYPFHGALFGGPDKSASSFRHRLAFPVYLPTDGAGIDLRWRTLGPASGFRLTVQAPDGQIVRELELDRLPVATTHHEVLLLDQETLVEHKSPRWSAAYWTAIMDLDAGAVEYDLTGIAAYPGGVLPAVEHTPPPPPPPPTPKVPHEPIVIATDADFSAANGVTSGSGTLADPYVIEGWDIDPVTGNGITLGGRIGTSSHVLIRDVRVHDTAGNCIELGAVQHVRIRDSIFDGCNFAINARGGSDLVVEDSTFEAVKHGPSFYGAQGVRVRRNVITGSDVNGIIIGQGVTQQSTVSLDVVIEDNTLLGAHTDLFISSPGAIGVEVRRNTFGEGAFVNLQIVPALPRISDSLWLDGRPRIGWAVLTAPHDDLPLATIVDAGSDADAGGRVCFEDARAEIVGATVTSIAWDLGDGTAATGLHPCHDYAPGSYEARLTVTLQHPDGATEVLEDSVLIG